MTWLEGSQYYSNRGGENLRGRRRKPINIQKKKQREKNISLPRHLGRHDNVDSRLLFWRRREEDLTVCVKMRLWLKHSPIICVKKSDILTEGELRGSRNLMKRKCLNRKESMCEEKRKQTQVWEAI